MRKYILFIFFLLLIPVYLFATDGVSTVEHPAKVNSVATPDKVNTVSGLAAAGGYNSGFSTDSNCVALYKFESGALTTDSKGGNTLVLGGGSPVADAVDYKEGAACVDFELGDSDYYTVADGDLDAAFPFKNGGSETAISVCFWVKIINSYSFLGLWLGYAVFYQIYIRKS